MGKGKPGWRDFALVAALYYAGAKLGMLTVIPEGMAVLWPSNGVVLAALLCFSGARAPAFFAVVVATELVADVPKFSVAEALAFGVINFGEAYLAFRLLERLRFDARFATPADLAKFVLAAPACAALASSLLGAAVYTYFRGGETGYLQFALTWWIGDALGLMIVTPLFLCFPPFGRLSELRAVPFTALDAAVWTGGAVVVATFWLAPSGGPLPMQLAPTLLVPGVLYAAARYPQRWAAFAVFCAAVLVMLALVQGRQPFGPLPARAAVLHAQEFLFFLALLGIGFAALLSQLRTKNAELDLRIAERTAELAQANERLAAIATTDALTGIANRRRFDEALAAETARSVRYGRPLTLIMADLDHFKAVNDTYGHAAGDAVLRRFAQVLQDNARAADVVARYGGEEFAVLLPETGAEEAIQVAGRMGAALAGLRIPPLERPVTATFGVAPLIPGQGAEGLVAAADRALYKGKREGRNRVVLSGKSTHSSPV